LKKTTKFVAVLAAATLAFGVAAPTAATAAPKTKACLALDTGGVDDKSFNAASWAGANSVKSSSVSVEYLPAASSADYAGNIKKFVDKKCTVIIGVGFAISSAIVASAKKNPKISYAVVDDAALDCNADFSVCKPVKNVKGLTFATQEAAFLAGYVAAGTSKSGIVATYGGAPYPTVTAFMSGYKQGVDYFNTKNKKSVKVLGWDGKNGEFIGDFSNTAKALQTSKNFEQAGADVIMPVAGGLGASTAQNSMDSKKSSTIWVDTDGYFSASKYKSVLLTSVMKGLGESVASVISEVNAGKFTNTAYVGTLKNGGAKIAPFHDLAKTVPSKVQVDVRAIAKDIIAGKIKVTA
jgi:basic membrane protein A